MRSHLLRALTNACGSYLTIDWERKNFSISQCVFNDAALNGAPQLVAILPKDAVPSQLPSPPAAAKSSSPSTGEIAGIVVGVIVILALLIGGFAIFKLKQRRKKNRSPEPAIIPLVPQNPSAYSQNQNEHSKGELATGREHERYELPSKSPSAAFIRSEKPRDFDGHTRTIGVKDDQPYVLELPSPDPDLSLPLQPVHEMDSPSLRPVAAELAANEPPKHEPLYGSSADDPPDHGPSPPYRSATTSPIPRSMGPSPFSQPSESPPTMHASGGPLRPGLHSRTSTMNSLPSSRHSLPSNVFPTGFSPPNRSSSVSSPPISPMASPMAGALPESGLGISSVLSAGGQVAQEAGAGAGAGAGGGGRVEGGRGAGDEQAREGGMI